MTLTDICVKILTQSRFGQKFIQVENIPPSPNLLEPYFRALFSIPVSNADCERIFSMVNIKKNEKQNRLSNVSLTNELLYGKGIRKAGECTKVHPTHDMIKSMNKNIYNKYFFPNSVIVFDKIFLLYVLAQWT